MAPVTTDQPDPPTAEQAGPLRPPAPASVLTAARFMHAAIGTAAYLIVALPFIGDIQGKKCSGTASPRPR